jgi:hypothetical protein
LRLDDACLEGWLVRIRPLAFVDHRVEVVAVDALQVLLAVGSEVLARRRYADQRRWGAADGGAGSIADSGSAAAAAATTFTQRQARVLEVRHEVGCVRRAENRALAWRLLRLEVQQRASDLTAHT